MTGRISKELNMAMKDTPNLNNLFQPASKKRPSIIVEELNKTRSVEGLKLKIEKSLPMYNQT